jgi:hypothetical protein
MVLSEKALLERLRRNDRWVVARPLGWPITVNKIHALEYGIIVGIIVGLVGAHSAHIAISGLCVALVVSFGVSVEDIYYVLQRTLTDVDSTIGQTEDPRMTLAILTIQHKPHYFWSTALPTTLLTTIVYSWL